MQQQQQQNQKVLEIDEQFAQMVVAIGGIGQRLGFVVMSSPPHPPVPIALAAVGVPIGSVVVVGDYQNERGGMNFFNIWVFFLIYFNYLISIKIMWHFFIFNLKKLHVASIEWPLEL